MVGDHVRKRNGLRKGDADAVLGREEREEDFGVVLQEGLFNILNCGGEHERENCQEMNDDVGHL